KTDLPQTMQCFCQSISQASESSMLVGVSYCSKGCHLRRPLARRLLPKIVRFFCTNRVRDVSILHCTVIEKLCWPCPCGPLNESLAFQSPAMSILVLARYWPGVFVRSMVLPECITIRGMFMSRSNFTLPASTSCP